MSVINLNQDKRKDNDQPQAQENKEENVLIDNDMITQSSPKNKLMMNINTFLKAHSVYEAVPLNMKILVFNNHLTIKNAIQAMIKQDIFCSLVWNSCTEKYSGIITLRDIIILLSFIHDKFKPHKEPIFSITFFLKEIFHKNLTANSLEVIKEDKNDKISSENQSYKSEVFGETVEIEDDCLRGTGFFDQENKGYYELLNGLSCIDLNDYLKTVKGNLHHHLLTITLDANLYECLDMISFNRIHRLIVEDPKTKKYGGFITYETIFDYFIETYYGEMEEFNVKVNEVSLVSAKLISLNKDDKIFSAFEYFIKHQISILPIYEDEECEELFGFIYLKDFAFFFTNCATFSFNDTIEKFLYMLYKEVDEEKPYGKERIVCIDSLDISWKDLFEKITISPERKVIVHKGDWRNMGLITLSNLFNYIISYKPL